MSKKYQLTIFLKNAHKNDQIKDTQNTAFTKIDFFLLSLLCCLLLLLLSQRKSFVHEFNALFPFHITKR